MNPKLLVAVGVPATIVDAWTEPLTLAATRFEIDSPARLVPWLANIAHESAGLTRLEENLRYSAGRLMEVFPQTPRRPWGFTPEEAHDFSGQPGRIANRIYADRNGNGDEASGDGWLFRGRGPIQITGRANYHDAGEAIGIELEHNPEDALRPRIGAMIAGWFWQSRGCNELADKGDAHGIRRRINGGLLGVDEVLAKIHSADLVGAA